MSRKYTYMETAFLKMCLSNTLHSFSLHSYCFILPLHVPPSISVYYIDDNLVHVEVIFSGNNINKNLEQYSGYLWIEWKG